MSKKYLISFASPDLKLSVTRYKEQAEKLNFYDQIDVYGINDLEPNYKNLIINFIKKGKKIGFGYWFWKPLIIIQKLKTIKYGDIINYTDIGCHFNEFGKDRLNYYINKLKNSNKGILGFQYKPLDGYDKKKFEFPEITESKYTKSDLFDYLEVIKRNDIVSTPQYWAGNIFLIKNDFSISFIEQWINVFKYRFDLVDDTPSKIANFKNFISNKHDQSVYSLLCKIHDIDTISAYECEWFYSEGVRYWDHTKNMPIIARRDKKYNILKRFINRQKKTFNRFYHKIFNN